ncbi:MAG: trigger factor [Ruminococcaceae bacterium]|nr:trigger factor [Oscillospiraceae bacterium]
MLLTEIKPLENGEYELKVKIEAEAFNNSVEAEYKKNRRKINVPGFRKGKAPRSIIEKMYGESFFYDDALNNMLGEVYENAVSEAKLRTIGKPNVEVESIDKKDGVILTFVVTKRPELGIGNYKGLNAKKHLHPVEESDIDSEIERMRERASRLITVEDRAAKDGDIASIDFEGFVDGVPFEGGKAENYSLILGSGQFIPGFEDKIVGHEIGEEFDIEVTFPEDYNAEELAGKDSVFKIKLNELKYKELPELDDEFVKDVSEFDTIAELREDISNKLKETREKAAETGVENQLGELLSDLLIGEIPDVMIEDRIDDMARDFSYRLGAQGLDVDNYLKYTNQDSAAFRDGFRESAKKQVSLRLALEAVARAENIEITEEDIDSEFVKLSEQYKMDVDKIKSFIHPDDLSEDLKANKALDIVRKNAIVVDDIHNEEECEVSN